MKNIKTNEYPGKDAIAYGKIVTFDIKMDSFPDKRPRTIRVWLPEAYDGKRRFPVLYMHDAQNLFSGTDEGSSYKWYLDVEMAVLEEAGLPAIIVGVDTALPRFSELCPDMPINPAMYPVFGLSEELIPTGHLYAAFISTQLKPLVDEHFMTLPDVANTAIGGASMGGLISLYMLLKYPNIYSKALVFAPNFIMHTEDELLGWLGAYDFSKLKKSRVFIFHGGLELDAINWPYVRTVFEAMRDAGMDEEQLALVYDSRSPHFESAWHKYFGEAYRFLFD